MIFVLILLTKGYVFTISLKQQFVKYFLQKDIKLFFVRKGYLTKYIS